jgi:toxin-antitoxin system PIN domain toxin
VIAPDVNLLIYAYTPEFPFHKASRIWMSEVLSGLEPVGIPLFCIHGFLRFVTNATILRKPLTFAEAAAIVNTWLALPQVQILYPGDRHWLLLQTLSKQVRLSGAQITDAAIAAIAIEYGAVVYTNDRDFARFPGLRWVNPLESA